MFHEVIVSKLRDEPVRNSSQRNIRIDQKEAIAQKGIVDIGLPEDQRPLKQEDWESTEMLFRNDKKDNRDLSNGTVPLQPLRELIAFPHEIYSIFVGRQKSIKALEAAEAAKKPLLLLA